MRTSRFAPSSRRLARRAAAPARRRRSPQDSALRSLHASCSQAGTRPLRLLLALLIGATACEFERDRLPSDGRDDDRDGGFDASVDPSSAFDARSGQCVDDACPPPACEPGSVDTDGEAGNRCTCATTSVNCDDRDNDCYGAAAAPPDIEHDPDNCGACGRRCSVQNGEAACLNGECVFVRCAARFGDADGRPENGCECQMTADPEEVCDGVDNDCDGWLDAELIGDRARPKCACAPEEFAPSSEYVLENREEGSVCGTKRCPELDGPDGMAAMEYCCNAAAAWSQCEVWKSEDVGFDLSTFDADTPSGGKGILEVVFRLDTPVEGLGLSLWYGKWPRRKKFVLLTAAETRGGLGPLTVVRYLRPTEAECPSYRQAEVKENGFQGFPDSCAVAACPDEPDGQDVSARCAEANAAGRVCPGGKWTSIDAACGFDYSSAPFYITAEGCDADANGTVRLLSVRLFGDTRSCLCESDADCVGSRLCHASAALEAPFCVPADRACAGLCSEAPRTCEGEGQDCEVVWNGRRCTSRISCVTGTPVCEIRSGCGG